MSDNILVAHQVVKRFGGLLATDHFDFELPRGQPLLALLAQMEQVKPLSSIA